MKKQTIIAIDREYGSGGKYVAKAIAAHYNISLYHHDLVKLIKGIDVEKFEKYDESGKIFGLSRTVKGKTNSIEEILTKKQSEFLLEKAKSGESFVVVGHCADVLLKEYEGLIRIFMTGDTQDKILRTMERENVGEKEAINLMKTYDRKRSRYYRINTDNKWGESKNYDLVINSSYLDLDDIVDTLVNIIDKKQEQ